MDKAYEIANITKDPLSRDKDTSLRTLVYMVRCAYAHGIADPRWQVRNDYKQFHPPKSLVGASGLDFSTLDGKSFDFDQIGGYQNWFFTARSINPKIMNIAGISGRKSVP